MSGLLLTIRKAEAGSRELLDAIEEGMRLGLDQKIDDVLDERERELVSKKPRLWIHAVTWAPRRWGWLQGMRIEEESGYMADVK